MARIFISYARKDAGEIADELADQLRAKDHEVFLDVQSIRAGARWRTELSRRIKWSNLIVVLVTEGSNTSDYVYQEIREAEQHGKTIVPVKIGDTPLPVHLRGTWQAITLEDNNLDAVLLEIQSALLHSSGSRTISPMIVVGAVVAIVLIGILAVMLLQNGDDGQNTQSGTETHVAGGVTETEILEDAPIATATPEAPTATNTDSPTPTITLTRTPRPTNTPRPPTNTPTLSPTPTDIPENAILFEEDFESGVAEDFSVINGRWTVEADETGNMVYTTVSNMWHQSGFGSFRWQNYAVEADIKIVESDYRELLFMIWLLRTPSFGGEQSYAVGFNSRTSIDLFYLPAWTYLTGYSPIQIEENIWYKVRIEVENSNIRVFVDNILLIARRQTRLNSGSLALNAGPGTTVHFDNIRVWSLDGDS